jgi:hypothetical protein
MIIIIMITIIWPLTITQHQRTMITPQEEEEGKGVHLVVVRRSSCK